MKVSWSRFLLGLTLVALTTQPSQAAGKRDRNTSHYRPSGRSVTVNPSSNPASFHPDMGFGEAIGILRNATNPPINIVVLWKDLENNADIDRDTLIGMDGVRGVPMKTHLDLLLSAVAAENPTKLRYAVQGGVILIGTEDTLRTRQLTRVYDVTDLVQPPADYFFLGRPLIGRTLPLGIAGTPGLF